MASRSAKLNPLRGEFEFNLDGKKVRGHASVNSLRMMCVDRGKRLDQLEEVLNGDELGAMAELIYYSCVNYAHRKGVEFEIEKQMFIALALDDIEAMADAARVVMESIKVAKESQPDQPKK